jgi:hypothetical protein
MLKTFLFRTILAKCHTAIEVKLWSVSLKYLVERNHSCSGLNVFEFSAIPYQQTVRE